MVCLLMPYFLPPSGALSLLPLLSSLPRFLKTDIQELYCPTEGGQNVKYYIVWVHIFSAHFGALCVGNRKMVTKLSLHKILWCSLKLHTNSLLERVYVK